MRDLLEYILKGIIDENEFEVDEKEDNGQKILLIKVKSESAGLVIGKGGQTIKSIQNIISVRARKENQNVFVKVIDQE